MFRDHLQSQLDGKHSVTVADAVSACLNAISGTRLALYRRRGIEHFLDPATFDAGITRKTLDVMWDVVRAHAEVPRRYLRRKAALLGRERLGFADLMAPLPIASQRRLSWEEGRERILDAFAGVYPELGRFAAEAYERRWIDHTPRPGKRPVAWELRRHEIGELGVRLGVHPGGREVRSPVSRTGYTV